MILFEVDTFQEEKEESAWGWVVPALFSGLEWCEWVRTWCAPSVGSGANLDFARGSPAISELNSDSRFLHTTRKRSRPSPDTTRLGGGWSEGSQTPGPSS